MGLTTELCVAYTSVMRRAERVAKILEEHGHPKIAGKRCFFDCIDIDDFHGDCVDYVEFTFVESGCSCCDSDKYRINVTTELFEGDDAPLIEEVECLANDAAQTEKKRISAKKAAETRKEKRLLEELKAKYED